MRVQNEDRKSKRGSHASDVHHVEDGYEDHGVAYSVLPLTLMVAEEAERWKEAVPLPS